MGNQKKSTKLPTAEDFKSEDFKHSYNVLLEMYAAQNQSQLINDIQNFVQNRFFFKGKENITTNQLRNIYDQVKKSHINQVQMIRPKLAYVAARQNNPLAREIVKFFDELINNIDNEKKLESFKDFFEAIVAYHKFYSPKN